MNNFPDLKDNEILKPTNKCFNVSEFNINKILKDLKEIPLKDRTSFYKEEQLIEGEDEFTEFKNYYFPLEEDKVEELKRQFCAFLNNKGGRLYIGINDLPEHIFPIETFPNPTSSLTKFFNFIKNSLFAGKS